MERCKDKDLKLNAETMQLRLKEVTYMGHRITADGLKVDPTSWKRLGMVNYVQKFAPKLAEITTPVRKLINKGNEFIREEHTHGKALEEVRQILSQPPVLRFFDTTITPLLPCDASMNELAACLLVLLQNNQPVAYASRSLTPTEVHYAQIEKEMLAIVWNGKV